jgi:FkbH-like protein
VCISLSPGIRLNNAAILTLTQVKTLNLLRQWVRRFSDVQKNAVVQALESASLSKIRRALRLLDELDPEQRGPRLDVELLSTYNLEPILPAIQLSLDCIPSRAKLRLAPLDAIEAQVSQESKEPAHARIILWRIEEALPDLLYPFTNGFPEQLVASVDQFLERVERVVSLHQKNAHGVPLFLSTIALPVNFSNVVFAAQDCAGLFASVARTNQKIYQLATRDGGVHVLDVAGWAAFEGKSHADATLDLMARQPLSAKGQVALALFIARCLRPLIVPGRKGLAVDLDNTLWGGVVGEDGVAGLKLGHDFPGNVHLRIQRELLELRNRGLLLVVLSKNNEPDVRQVFDSLPEMLLKWEDFAVRKINWNHKHENLREAARELGLGVDSFAFVDDSDYEREQMRQYLPEVLILNEGSDPLQTLRSLWETDAFDSLAVSEEDRLRHRDYTVRAVRDVEAHQDDLEAFLKSLEMEATIEEIGPSNMERVVTMLGKTNQFNLTTRRHGREQVQAMLELPGSILLTLRLRDKFGEQGIVALSLAVPSNDSNALQIDSFLVSCRALGRGVEDALWSAMVSRALAQGVRKLDAEYRATAKNALAAKFYDKVGLQSVAHDSSAVHYRLEPIEPHPSPSWIVVHNRSNER